MTQQYAKLKSLLAELFQLDRPDLDFGLYRIMHLRADEVTRFLDDELLPQVRSAFDLYRPFDRADLQTELHRLRLSIEAAGLNPDDSPKVRDLREALATNAVDIAALEQDVYDHLYRFFRRYYSDGDFLAKRVYKEGVYAIPYEGQESLLSWANQEQYYIKTSETLSSYAFRLQPDAPHQRRVHFRIVDGAEGEHGTVKEDDEKARHFILAAGEDCVEEVASELIIRFEYRSASLHDWPTDSRSGKTKPPSQKELIDIAVMRVMDGLKRGSDDWSRLLHKKFKESTGRE